MLKGGVEVKIPEGIPTTNKVGGQRRMLDQKKNQKLSGTKLRATRVSPTF